MNKTPLDIWKEKNPDKADTVKKQQEENTKTRPWDLLNPNKPRTENELASIRYSICLECPELIKLTKQCRKCGCFMESKTKLETASCPIGKW
jgi:hypothetical protein